ncbi:MAG: CHAT domain-containing protein [Chitinophagales bacterium]
MELKNANDNHDEMNKEVRLEWAKGELEWAKELYENGKYEDSIKICEKLEPIFEKLDATKEYRNCLNYWFGNLKTIGAYMKSIKIGRKVLEKKSKLLIQDIFLTTTIYNNLGICNSNLDNQSKAIFYHKQALAIYNTNKIKYRANIAYTNFCLANCFFNQTKYIKAIELLELAIEGFKKDGRDKNIVYFGIMFNLLGSCYLCLEKTKIALFFFQKSLSIRSKLYKQIHPEVAEVYTNLSVCFYKKRNHDKTFLCLKIAKNIYNLNDNLYNNLTLKINTGAAFFSKKEINIALDYFKEAEYLMNNITIAPNKKAKLYENIGLCYHSKQNYNTSIQYLQKALNIRLASLNKEHINIAMSYINLGNSYTAKQSLKEGLQHLEKGLNQLLTFHSNNIISLALANGSFGEHYMKCRNYKESLKHFQLVFNYNIKKYNNNTYFHNPKKSNNSSEEYLLTTFKNKIIVFYKFYQQTQDIKYLQAALFTAQVTSVWINYVRNSFSSDSSKLFLAKYTFEIFENAIQIAFKAASVVKNNIEQWQAVTDEIAAINADSYPKKTFKYCKTEQDCLYAAFDFCEQSRAIILLGNMKDDEAKGRFIPRELLKKENNLKIKLTYLKKRIEVEYKKEDRQDKKKLLQWQNQYLNYDKEHDELRVRFEKEYPEYHRLKYNTKTVDISTLQQTLAKNSYIIEYFVTNTHLYTFVIGQNDYKMYEKKLPNDFDKHLKNMQKWFLPNYKRSMPSKYIAFARALYQTLLEQVMEEWQFPQNSTLIIIPDGKLSKIPFEALLTRKPTTAEYSYMNMPYLLLQYDVMYHYSATLYHHSQQKIKPTTTTDIINGFVGFAPVFSKNAKNYSEDDVFFEETIQDIEDPKIKQEIDNIKAEQKIKRKDISRFATANTLRNIDENGDIVALENSETEVISIVKEFEQKNLKAVPILHEKATIEQFKNLAHLYKYVLIASHGDFNVERPEQTGILFSPETNKDTILYMNEVYNLNLNADLLVLSCCESGVGAEAKGEGVMAMNRGFLYAGAKNVVFTLFKIHDEASYLLTSAFFRHILAGKSYKKALRLAKKELIQQANINPVHWSGFVLIGQ